ncbi:S1 family peptidase [Actinokineospora inagensis]|uniref:S1 family peptidase n=1 Tax=Actinokineospora inagensis TaxID=103730 RepID=UPI00040005DD|nr:serine protease [Actinokineospora inagensis]
MLRRLVPVAALVAAFVTVPLSPAPPIMAADLGKTALAAGVSRTGAQVPSSTALEYGNNGNSWSTTITVPGATYVKVHFAPLKLVGDDYLTVSSPSGRETYTYYNDRTKGSPFTVHGQPGFAAMSIDGDTAVVTLHATAPRDAKSLSRQGYGVRVTRYDRGFGSAEFSANNPTTMSVCGNDARKDVVCYQTSHPVEYTRSNAVARQLVDGIGSCTAWRVGNTNRMLTNAHCVDNATDLRASEFQFDYQCATCGGNNPRTGTKVSGQDLIRTSSLQDLDYTLFSVTNFDTIRQYGTLYLDVREPTAGERIYIAGHGDIKPKRMSIYEDTEGGATCKIDVASSGVNTGYRCDSSGGNSGSPVLAGSSHKVIALHHLGGCPNWGTRISLVYNEIRGDIDNTSSEDPAQITLQPSSGNTSPGGSVNAAVQASTSVTFSASGLPSGVTASFNPPSGQSSTLTISTAASTPPGTYVVTVTGGGMSATYTLTVGGAACPNMKVTKSGNLSSGGSQYQPDGSFFQAAAGVHQACLTGPPSANFDVYLQKWNGSTWPVVAQGTSAGANETFSYNGTAGYYRYQVKSVTGGGQYTLGYNAP